MKIDSNGNVYLTGESGFFSELFAAKFSPGGELIYFADLGTADIFGFFTSATAFAVGTDGSVHIVLTHFALGFSPYPGSTLVNLDPFGNSIPNTQLITSLGSRISDVATDSDGDLFVTGVGEPLQSTPGSVTNPQGNGFTYAIDPTLSHVLWAVNGIGGSHIAVDQEGVVYLAGTATSSTEIPVNAFQSTYNPTVCPSCTHQFVTALNASGTQVVYSTYLTGTYGEIPEGLAVDANENIYVGGVTVSTDYPTTSNALQTVFPAHGPADFNYLDGVEPATGYISSLDPTGKIRFSTFFGGSATDEITSIDYMFGSIYVGGSATSPDLPGLSVPDHYCVPQQFLSELTPYGKLSNRTLLLPDFFAYVPIAQDTVVVSQSSELEQLNFTAPETPIACLANSANVSPTTAAAPGQLVTVFGGGLAAAPQAAAATAGVLPTSLEGVSILINGVAAPLLYVSPNQINFQVPFEVAGQSQVTLQLQTQGQDGPQIADSRTLSIVLAQPTVFEAPVALGECPGSYLGENKTYARNQDGTENGCANPAQPNSTVTIFVDGLGNLVPPAQTGGIASNMAALTVPIALLTDSSSGQPLPVVLSANALAGSVSGLYAIQVQVPPTSSTAIFSIGGISATGLVAIAVAQ